MGRKKCSHEGNKKDLKNRLEKLKDKIDYWLNEIPSRDEYMFYDEI